MSTHVLADTSVLTGRSLRHILRSPDTMITTAVTPIALLASQVATGGTPVQVVAAGPNGGFITNPSSADDQGISAAEPLYISPVSATPGSAPGNGNGTTFVLYPGQTWTIIPGQSTATFVNAATSGHKFSGVSY